MPEASRSKTEISKNAPQTLNVVRGAARESNDCVQENGILGAEPGVKGRLTELWLKRHFKMIEGLAYDRKTTLRSGGI